MKICTYRTFITLEFALGNEKWSGPSGSIVQKYAYYGTRLEPGIYQVVLEMKTENRNSHYLAAEFETT